MLVSGIARSVALTAFSTVAFSDVAPEQMRDANSISATSFQVSAGLAIAVSTIALRPAARSAGCCPARRTPGPPTASPSSCWPWCPCA
ncbi:hypothetical protein ACFQ9X_24610 [Catenulispora yoronensis]